MSKIDKYDMYMYPSISAALRELIAPHRADRVGDVLGATYTEQAYEEAAAFLCVNDIPHAFTICPISSRLSARVIMVCWTDAKGESNLGWWEKKEVLS